MTPQKLDAKLQKLNAKLTAHEIVLYALLLEARKAGSRIDERIRCAVDEELGERLAKRDGTPSVADAEVRRQVLRLLDENLLNTQPPIPTKITLRRRFLNWLEKR